jgi:hypothetical protein
LLSQFLNFNLYSVRFCTFSLTLALSLDCRAVAKPESIGAAKGSNTARVKAATYDGTSSWLDYKSHFDGCSRINQWSENEKGLYLAVHFPAYF